MNPHPHRRPSEPARDRQTKPRRPMPWAREQIRAARRAPLAPILRSLGYALRPEPEGNFRIIPGVGPIDGPDDHLVIKDNYWCWPTRGPTGDAGNTIDFLVRVHGLSFHQAMELISNRTED